MSMWPYAFSECGFCHCGSGPLPVHDSPLRRARLPTLTAASSTTCATTLAKDVCSSTAFFNLAAAASVSVSAVDFATASGVFIFPPSLAFASASSLACLSASSSIRWLGVSTPSGALPLPPRRLPSAGAIGTRTRMTPPVTIPTSTLSNCSVT